LEALVLRDNMTGNTESVSASALFVLIGAEPHTDWLPAGIQRDKRDFLLTGSDLRRDNPPDSWPLQRPRFRSKRACRACLRPGTSVSVQSSVSPQRSVEVRSPQRR